MSFYPAKGGGGDKLEDHCYIGLFKDNDGNRNTVLTIDVPNSIRKNRPIRYVFAIADYSYDGPDSSYVPSYDLTKGQNGRECTITGDGTFTIQTGSNRIVYGTYIVFF